MYRLCGFISIIIFGIMIWALIVNAQQREEYNKQIRQHLTECCGIRIH